MKFIFNRVLYQRLQTFTADDLTILSPPCLKNVPAPLAKALQYEHLLKNNSTHIWNVLRKLLTNTKAADAIPLPMQEGDRFATSQEQSAELYSNFFVDVVNNLANNVKSAAPPKIYLKSRVLSSFVLFPSTAAEVSQEITRLKIKKLTSLDQIPSFFLKTAADVIAPYLVLLVNYIFTDRIFPTSSKSQKLFRSVNQKQNLKHKIITPSRYFHLFLKSLKSY